MSEWGRLQDALHDEFDRQGVTGVDVDRVIEHIVNLRDFFPGLLGAERSEPARPADTALLRGSLAYDLLDAVSSVLAFEKVNSVIAGPYERLRVAYNAVVKEANRAALAALPSAEQPGEEERT